MNIYECTYRFLRLVDIYLRLNATRGFRSIFGALNVMLVSVILYFCIFLKMIVTAVFSIFQSPNELNDFIISNLVMHPFFGANNFQN